VPLTLPDASEFWRRPPRQIKGNFAPAPIFLAVGEALSAWELVESEFANLFGILVETESFAAVRAYGVITSTRTRQDMFEQAGSVFFRRHSSLVDEEKGFAKALSHYTNASWRRNELAHGTATYLLHDTERDRTFLMPPDHNSNKVKLDFQVDVLNPEYAYTAEDILAFGDKFRTLRLRMRSFNGQLIDQIVR
jgi:hypothetical protein